MNEGVNELVCGPGQIFVILSSQIILKRKEKCCNSKVWWNGVQFYNTVDIAIRILSISHFINFLNFFSSWRKLCFHEKYFFEIFISGHSKWRPNVQRPNVQKSGLEKISECACVRMYVGKFKLVYLRNYSSDRAKSWCAPKARPIFGMVFVKVH